MNPDVPCVQNTKLEVSYTLKYTTTEGAVATERERERESEYTYFETYLSPHSYSIWTRLN